MQDLDTKSIFRGQEPPKMYVYYTSPGDGHASCKVLLTSIERRRCSNKAKARSPSKFAGVAQTCQPVSAVIVPKFTNCEDTWRRYCCLTVFFPIIDTCLSYKDIVQQSYAMVCRWRIFVSYISSEPCAAHFRPAF